MQELTKNFSYSRLVFYQTEEVIDASEIPQNEYLYTMPYITRNIDYPEENPGRVVVDMDNRPLKTDSHLVLDGQDHTETLPTRFCGSEPNTFFVPKFELRYFTKTADMNKWMKVVELELKLHGLLTHLSGRPVSKEFLYEPAVKYYLNEFGIAFLESTEANQYKREVEAREIARRKTIKEYPEAISEMFKKVVRPREQALLQTLEST